MSRDILDDFSLEMTGKDVPSLNDFESSPQRPERAGVNHPDAATAEAALIAKSVCELAESLRTTTDTSVRSVYR